MFTDRGLTDLVTAILLEGMYVESCLQHKLAMKAPLTRQEFLATVAGLGVHRLILAHLEMKRNDAALALILAKFGVPSPKHTEH